jgi:hypothetical protein
MNMKRRFSESWAKALAAVMVIGAIVAPVYSITADNSQPRDNNNNSIIFGGCYSKSECLTKMNSGDGHGHNASNIMGVYNDFGITKAEFNSGNTVNATVFKDGRVVINQNFGNFKSGDVIATNSWSVGRNFVAGSWKFGSVWARHENAVFQSNSIQAFANVQNGKMQWFILKSCGNAGNGNAVPMPQPKQTPKPTARPSTTPSLTPAPTAAPTHNFECVRVDTSLPDENQPDKFEFTIVPLTGGDVRLTGFRFTFSDNRIPVDNAANQPSVDAIVPSGTDLKVFGQVKTTAGTTDISRDCMAEVNRTVTTTSVVTTPSPTPAVLSASTAPLPATGPESALGGVAGVSAIGVAARAYMKSRKGLLASLRKRK